MYLISTIRRDSLGITIIDAKRRLADVLILLVVYDE